MATLTGELISETYDSLLKVSDNNTITGVKKRITDGLGNEIPLQISSTDIQIDGVLILSALTDLDVATKFLSLKADNSVGFRTALEVLSDIGGASASDLSLYVPYTGATSDLNLGDNSLTAQDIIVSKNGYTSTITFPESISPSSDRGFIEHFNPESDNSIMRFSVSDNEVNDYFVFGNTQGLVFNERFKITSDGEITANKIQNATTDTDKFLVSDGGTFKYRTGAELLSDIGGASAGSFVPYTGATANLDLGAFNLLSNAITLDPTPATLPTAQGSMYFDEDEQTIAAILNGSTMKIGEDSFIQIKNQSGSTIPKGTPVRFDGVVGASGRVLAVPFLANGTYPSLYFLGVTYESIANGGDGKALVFGKVRGINTNAYTAGTILYASSTVAGGFQTTAPIAPNNIISVCAVVTQGTSNGTILIRPQIGSNINNDEGVRITAGTTGDILQLQAGGLWENKSGNAAGFVTIAGTQTITGAKTFSLDTTINGLNIGRGGGNIVTNTRVGDNSLLSNTTGTDNSAFGTSSLSSNTIGFSNTGIGSLSLSSNTTGSENTAIGIVSLGDNTTGDFNTAIGRVALGSNISGSYNVGIGADAGYVTSLDDPNSTSSNSIFLGSFTKTLANNQTNQIVIGHSAVGLGSNTTVLGNSSTLSTAIWGDLLIGSTVDNGTDKLQVTGAVNITGQLKLGSTITNNTFTYTLPSATGTIALTSNLSSYLPLTGGTLTGALGGTSATFSSDLTSSGIISVKGTAPFFRWLNSSDVRLAYIQHNATNLVYNADTGIHVFNQAATFSGNVGIGTTSPSVKFNVNSGGTSGNSFSAAFSDNTTNQNAIAFSHFDNNSRIYATFLAGAGSNQSLSFWTTLSNSAQFERMRITYDGNVLIGTTTDNGAKLQVNGTISMQVTTATTKTITGTFAPILVNGTTYYLPLYN